MNDQLDNDLKNRIREVFDNFEDPTADEGWLLLREKFPVQEKKRPAAWLWWASTAAALLLFIGIGLWINGKNQASNMVAITHPVKSQHQIANTDSGQKLAVKPAPAIKNNVRDTISPAFTIAKVKHLVNKKPNNNNNSNVAVPVPQNNIANNTVNQPKKTLPVVGQPSGVTGNAPAYAGTTKPAVQQPLSKDVVHTPPSNGADSTRATSAQSANNQQYIAGNQVNAASAGDKQTLGPVKKTPPANSMEAIFASENSQPKKKVDESYNEKRVRFGVYAATFFNYAKGSANQMNAGAGITSDIRLSKNIKLSTGVALAQNTLSYSGNNPPPPTSGVMPASTLSTQQATFSAHAVFPVYKSYNANLVGLDIPMNLKYEFNPQKTDTYVSAGLSSGTFINEAYTASYGLPDKLVATGTAQQTTDEVTRKSFDGFYFAKTLNVAFGIGTPLGKNNRLIIEPFLKYPLDGMGAQQIKFGAGGLNLKLNFTTGKK